MKENEDEVMHAEVPLVFSKTIIRPWEEINHNKQKTSLGYEKEVAVPSFDFSKPIHFQGARFLNESSLLEYWTIIRGG